MTLMPTTPSLFDLVNEAQPVSAVDRAIIFASGASAAGDVRGFAAVGFAVGVSAAHFHEPGIQESLALVDTGMPLFLDNGAFEEFDVKTGKTRVDAKGREMLITDEQWQERFDIYDRMAAAFKERLYCVAPDKVGEQPATLERLKTYASRMRAVAATGANVMVSLHGGATPRLEFYWEAVKVLGFAPMPAFPIPAGITDDEILAVIVALKPKRAHLLGLGINTDRAPKLLERIAAVSPETAMSIDSCRIGAVVGIVRNKDGSVRRLKPYTKAQADDWSERGVGVTEIVDESFGIFLDRTDLWSEIGAWLPKDKNYREAVCAPLVSYWRLSEAEAATFVKNFVDPKVGPNEAFEILSQTVDAEDEGMWSDRFADPLFTSIIEGEMDKFIKEETAIGRRARGLAQVFTGEVGSGRYPEAMKVAEARQVKWYERIEWEIAMRDKRKKDKKPAPAGALFEMEVA